jgi:hypothetical protein
VLKGLYYIKVVAVETLSITTIKSYIGEWLHYAIVIERQSCTLPFLMTRTMPMATESMRLPWGA